MSTAFVKLFRLMKCCAVVLMMFTKVIVNFRSIYCVNVFIKCRKLVEIFSVIQTIENLRTRLRQSLGKLITVYFPEILTSNSIQQRLDKGSNRISGRLSQNIGVEQRCRLAAFYGNWSQALPLSSSVLFSPSFSISLKVSNTLSFLFASLFHKKN